MKAAPFAYVRPPSLDDAIAALAATDGEGKVLAGGQSLVPILAMRLARPSTLIDLNEAADLDTLFAGDDHIHVGAMVRQRRLEHAPEASVAAPLLGLALPWVGHRELRSRGTVCGSLAHADPAAELPAVACCLGAVLQVTGPAGSRLVAAADFFSGAMTTVVGPDEILTAVRFPLAHAGDGYGFAEVARRHGDFALAGAAVHVRVRPGAGRLVTATLTAFGISDRPITTDATDLLGSALGSIPGTEPDPAAVVEALRDPMVDLARSLVDTAGDPHGSPAYRRRLLAHLGASQLAHAHRVAVETSGDGDR